MSIAGKWGFCGSELDELTHGQYETKEEAIYEAFDYYGDVEAIYVGQYRPPTMPWDCFTADWLIDLTLCQDDYCGDWADGVLSLTKGQEESLEGAVKPVIQKWFEDNNEVPEFGLIEGLERIELHSSDSDSA